MSDLDIQIGDRVRSFDFGDAGDPTYGWDLTGEKAAYAEGVVVDIVEERIGDKCYKIAVDIQIFNGRFADPNEFAFPPVNGRPMFGGNKTNGVRKIEAELTREQKLENALNVFLKNPETAGLLEKVDPKAMEQARKALGRDSRNAPKAD